MISSVSFLALISIALLLLTSADATDDKTGVLSKLVGKWSGYCTQFAAVYDDATTYCIPYKSLSGGPLVYSYLIEVSSDGSISYETGNSTVTQTTGNKVNAQTTSTTYFIGSYAMTGRISTISQYSIPGGSPKSVNSCVSIDWDLGSSMTFVWSLFANNTQLTEEGRYSVPGNDYIPDCSAKGRLYCTNEKQYNYICSAARPIASDAPPFSK